MKNILVVSGHPNFKDSLANKTIIENFKKLAPEAVIDDLSLVNNGEFDIAKEQAKLVAADVVIFQYPVYWYSFPALLKKWQDDVYTHGFAYGSTGNALRGKKVLFSFTAGAPDEAYHKSLGAQIDMEDLLISHVASANMVGMEVLAPVYSCGMLYIPGVSSEEDKKNVIAKAEKHAERLFNAVKDL